MDASVTVLEARAERAADGAAFVAAFCAHHGIGDDDALRLALVVEELFLNIVEHGYAGEAGTVRLSLSLDAEHVRLVCEDRARAYDPCGGFDRAPTDLDAPVESRGVGGLGQWIVGRLAEVERYERVGESNRLALRIRRRA